MIIRTPDKDLAQCVRGNRIVQLNRWTRVTLDVSGVILKFPPPSFPDYLALVGDSADGYPCLPDWRRKIDGGRSREVRPSNRSPEDSREWHVNAANARFASRDACPRARTGASNT